MPSSASVSVLNICRCLANTALKKKRVRKEKAFRALMSLCGQGKDELVYDVALGFLSDDFDEKKFLRVLRCAIQAGGEEASLPASEDTASADGEAKTSEETACVVGEAKTSEKTACVVGEAKTSE